MLNILINAYAVSPNWGSEQGMGWNWVINLARYCHIDIITEGEWKTDIENAIASLPYKDNLEFHYLPVTENIRKMCWNQGDWRFYWYYEKWQKRALKKAEEICSHKHIDILHQLNMIGFREPGYLWKIPDIPFIWGPVGGMELIPMAYLKNAPLKQRVFNFIKNSINRIQFTYSYRVKNAIERSSIIISAVKGVQDVLHSVHHKNSVLINETGVTVDSNELPKTISDNSETLKIIWVGKFDFRKQLPLALRAVAAMNNPNVELHICGTGSPDIVDVMKEIAENEKISAQCHWHGNIPNHMVRQLMAESDVMLFTSIMEATSTVVLEAISVGLPVISFNTCGFGPLVNDFAGITVELSNPTQSVQDFARELNLVEKDRSILSSISETISSRRYSLSYEAKAKETFSLYKQVLKS